MISKMTIEDLGYNDAFENFRIEHQLEGFDIGRVIAEHKERYIVKTVAGEFDAEITGNLRHTARSREDFPAVGDWVALISGDPGIVIIHSILPRFSMLSRQAVGKFGERQVIATNIDTAFLVQAVDRDYNINRLERYLTICQASKVQPVIVLTKTDLVTSQRRDEIIGEIRLRIKSTPIIAVSNETRDGYDAFSDFIKKGKTCCLLGSSGVGKSTLMNNLSGRKIMKTDAISESTQKGRHVTSHRELTVLESGGILIDNPGMREIGIADSSGAAAAAFEDINSLAMQCKFSDCTHAGETGCAVAEAVERGEIDRNSYENYLKIEREKAHFELTVQEKRKKDKAFGKMVKNVKNDMRKMSDKHKNR